MSGPWGKSSWADEVEEASAKPGNHPVAQPAEDDFPSLGAAMKQKQDKKTDKGAKKMQKLSLNEFLTKPAAANPNTYQAPGRAFKAPADEGLLMDLPKAPRGRDPNAPPEDPNEIKLGGAFKDDERYNRGDRGGRGGDRGERGGRGGGRGFGDREGRPERPERDEGPSRADTSDDWGRDRKNEPGSGAGARGGFGGDRERGGGFGGDRERGGGFGDRERGGGFGDRERPRRDRSPGFGGPGGAASRAEESDNWGKDRKETAPAAAGAGRGGAGGRGFGGGFGDRDRPGGFGGDRDRPGGFGDRDRERPPRSIEPSKADVEDKWGHKWEPTPAEAKEGRKGGEEAAGGVWGKRPAPEAAPAGAAPAAAAASGAAAPASRPRDDGFGKSGAADEDKVWKKAERPAPAEAPAADKAKEDRPPRDKEARHDKDEKKEGRRAAPAADRAGIEDDRWAKKEVKRPEPREPKAAKGPKDAKDPKEKKEGGAAAPAKERPEKAEVAPHSHPKEKEEKKAEGGRHPQQHPKERGERKEGQGHGHGKEAKDHHQGRKEAKAAAPAAAVPGSPAKTEEEDGFVVVHKNKH